MSSVGRRLDAGWRHAFVSVVSLSALFLTPMLLAARPASALPSYARQTGQECAACHNGFPELTPYGRLFKLNGYVFGGGHSDLPPVAAMIIPSFTHTQAGQPGGAAPHFGANNNFDASASLFYYGGAITSHLGVFAQATYDQTSRRLSWDNTDVRYANSGSLLGSELVYGASLNNNPSLTDVWNSTPAWGYPYLNSALAPKWPGTVVEGALAQQVVGASTYGYWNRLVYAEVGAYRGLSTRTETTLGVNSGGTNALKGLAPYWRLAVEPKWGQNSLEVGTFGLATNVIPGRVRGFGTDHIVDVGFDGQYQFLGARDSFSVQARWITENQNLTASQALGNSTNSRNHLRSLNAKATYYYDQTYGATVGYFNVAGGDDPALYGASSANNSPNTHGWVGELDYIPFNHGGPSIWPWLNVKLGLQYVLYERFNGGVTNFDGAGRNAHDNNTIFAFVWIAF